MYLQYTTLTVPASALERGRCILAAPVALAVPQTGIGWRRERVVTSTATMKGGYARGQGSAAAAAID